MKAYFVPLKGDIGGHIMFLETTLGITTIFQSNYYPSMKPSQNKVGTYTGDLNVDFIKHWCNNHFKTNIKHPAIYKMNFETMQQELCMDSYIEDYVNENYDEIIRRLDENNSINK